MLSGSSVKVNTATFKNDTVNIQSRIWGSDHLKEKGSVSKKTINKPGVKAPYAALKIVHLSVVSSRQR